MFVIICLVFVVINCGIAGKITTLDKTPVYHGNTSLYGVRTFRQKDKEEAGPRIVGGKEAWLHSWPWQVVLSRADVPVCGGAILNMYWILTASHCFRRNARESLWEVWAGKHDLDNDTESCQQNVKVSKIITHKDYNSVTKQHDIALLKLHTPLVFDECVRPVSPWSGDLPSLKRCTITGWGSTTQGGPHAKRLQEANVTILEFDTCVRFYGGIISPSMVCAGEMAGGLDACQGDSGGPLSCFTGTRYEVAGIVSWGVGCGHAQKPGVYTKVAFYIQWINSIIGGRFGADGSWKVLTVKKCGQAEVKPFRLYQSYVGLESSDPSGKPRAVNMIKGDAGAPLLCQRNWRYYPAAMMALGPNQCNQKKPAIFTSLSSFQS